MGLVSEDDAREYDRAFLVWVTLAGQSALEKIAYDPSRVEWRRVACFRELQRRGLAK